MGLAQGCRIQSSGKERVSIMTPGETYTVCVKIKVHTSPLREIEYTKTGRFVKESPTQYTFDSFRVRKGNITNIIHVE
jgi:hypothetical protein